MKDTKTLFTKALSLFLAALLLVALFTVPAFAEETIPDLGVIIDEDFEGYPADQLFPLRRDGGQFTRRSAYPAVVDGNTVWNINPTQNPGGGGNHLLFEWGAAGYGDAYVKTGKLVYEYDLCYPTPTNGAQLGDDQKLGHLVVTYSGAWTSGGENRAYLTYSRMVGVKKNGVYDGHIAQIWFPQATLGTVNNAPNETTVDLELDRFYHITHYVDFEKGELRHYIDGKLIATSTDKIARDCAFDELALYTSTTANVPKEFPLYMDNVKVARVSGTEPFSANISSGSGYIDLKFNKTFNATEFSARDFELKEFAGESLGAPRNMTINGCTLRLYYDGITEGKSYELFMNRGAVDTLFPANTIPAGKRFSVVTSVPTIDTVIMDLDFEDTVFPEDADGKKDAAFVDVYKSYLPGETTENPSVYGGSYEGWQYTKETEEYARIKPITFGGSTMMQIDLTHAMTLAEGAYDVVLPLDKSISSGTLDISFDVLKHSQGTHRVGFGLHKAGDIQQGAVFNPLNSHSVSTIFGGYSYWTGWTSSVVAGYSQQDRYNLVPDGYANPDNNKLKPNSGKWTDVEKDILLEKTFRPAEALESNVIRSWRFVINLDEQTYDVYLDGTLAKSYDYIPGGEAGTFDAFVIHNFITANGSAIDAYSARNLLLDNIKVVHKALCPTLLGATLTDYEGSDSAILDTVSAGTKTITLHFSTEMAEESLSNITLTDAKGTGFTVDVDGSDVSLELDNCLNAGSQYTLTVSKDFADLDGNTLGKDYVFSFTADEGEVIYGTPVISSMGTPLEKAGEVEQSMRLSVDAEIINTTAEKEPAYLILASYKNGEIAGIKAGLYQPLLGFYQDSASLIFAATEEFVDADELHAYWAEDEEGNVPLSKSYSIYNGTKATVSLSDPYGEGLFLTARYPTGDPILEGRNGRDGWLLIPKEENKSYISFDLDDHFEFDASRSAITVSVDYFDEGYGGFCFLYLGNGFLRSQFVQLKNTNRWQTATFTLYDFSYGDFTDLRSHFQIICNDSIYVERYGNILDRSAYHLIIGGVTLKVESKEAPYKIEVTTDYVGNNAVEGEPLNFDVRLYNTGSTGEKDGIIRYIVRDVSRLTQWSAHEANGEIVLEDSTSFTDYKGKISLPDTLPFGVYNLELILETDTVYQAKTIDFAYIPKAKINENAGVNIDFNDYWLNQTTETEQKMKLAKLAGYGFVRSDIHWKDAASGVPAGIKRAYELADSYGINMLCGISQIVARYQTTGLTGDASVLNGYHYVDTDNAKYAYSNFVSTLVGELKNYTKYFATANNFNLQGPGGWHIYKGGETKHNYDNWPWYVDLAKTTHDAISVILPEAVLVNGSVADYEKEWIAECIEAGILDSSDVFSINFESKSLAETINTAKAFKAQMEAAGAGGAWITDSGWPAFPDQQVANDIKHQMISEYEQAIWYPCSLAMAADSDVIDKFFHGNLVRKNNGYFNPENLTGIVRAFNYRTPFASTPAFVTTAAYNALVGNASSNGDQATETNIYAYSFTRADGSAVWMLWADSEASYSCSIPGAANIDVMDMFGNIVNTTINGSSITIGPEPVYVVRAN